MQRRLTADGYTVVTVDDIGSRTRRALTHRGTPGSDADPNRNRRSWGRLPIKFLLICVFLAQTEGFEPSDPLRGLHLNSCRSR